MQTLWLEKECIFPTNIQTLNSLKVYKKALTYNIVDCGSIRACQEVGEEIHHHNSILFGLEGEREKH